MNRKRAGITNESGTGYTVHVEGYATRPSKSHDIANDACILFDEG